MKSDDCLKPCVPDHRCAVLEQAAVRNDLEAICAVAQGFGGVAHCAVDIRSIAQWDIWGVAQLHNGFSEPHVVARVSSFPS